MVKSSNESLLSCGQTVRAGGAASAGARAELGGPLLAEGCTHRAAGVRDAVRAEVLLDERQGQLH